MELEEMADGWRIPVVGWTVIEITFSGSIYISAYGESPGGGQAAPETAITLAGDFTYTDQSGVQHYLTGDRAWEALVPLLSLRYARVASSGG
jgi:hypothetical protein